MSCCLQWFLSPVQQRKGTDGVILWAPDIQPRSSTAEVKPEDALGQVGVSCAWIGNFAVQISSKITAGLTHSMNGQAGLMI